MFFGFDMEKFLLLLVVAALLLGPERLPRYAHALAVFTKRAREWLAGARDRVKDEMGEDFDEIEWRKLDPRQYDPRRIIRDALLDDAPVPAVTATAAAPTPTPVELSARTAFDPDAEVPFDSQAT